MSNVIRWNPWAEMFALHNQMDQLFNGTLAGDGGANETSTLPIDVHQTDDAFVIEASVPGFAPDQVEVTLHEGVLTVRGSRESTSESDKKDYIRRERRMASVFRQVTLPSDIRSDEISAAFENGVLTVTVPRVPKAQPRRIPVQASSGARVIDATKSATS